MINWDSVISFLIIIFIILVAWARISQQTIKEVIIDIKDMIKGKSEDVEDEIIGGFYE